MNTKITSEENFWKKGMVNDTDVSILIKNNKNSSNLKEKENIIIMIKEVNNMIENCNDQKKKKLNILGLLLEKIEKISILNQSNHIEQSNKEKEGLINSLNKKQIQLNSSKSILSNLKRMFQLNSNKTNINSNELIVNENYKGDNQQLKLKIKELLLSNNNLTKEIEYYINENHYPCIILMLQNELKQLIHKKGEYSKKNLQFNKSIASLVIIFNKLDDLNKLNKNDEHNCNSKVLIEIKSELSKNPLDFQLLEKLFLQINEDNKNSSNNNHNNQLHNYLGLENIYSNKQNALNNLTPGNPHNLIQVPSIINKNNNLINKNTASNNKRSSFLPPIDKRTKSPLPYLNNIAEKRIEKSNKKIKITKNKEVQDVANSHFLTGLDIKSKKSNNDDLFKFEEVGLNSTSNNNQNILSNSNNKNSGNPTHNSESTKDKIFNLENIDENELLNIFLPDNIKYEDYSNHEYDNLQMRFNSLQELLLNMKKSLNVKVKTMKRKQEDLNKKKIIKESLLVDLREENDVINKDIDYIILQINQLYVERDVENYFKKEKINHAKMISELKEKRLDKENLEKDSENTKNVKSNTMNIKNKKVIKRILSEDKLGKNNKQNQLKTINPVVKEEIRSSSNKRSVSKSDSKSRNKIKSDINYNNSSTEKQLGISTIAKDNIKDKDTFSYTNESNNILSQNPNKLNENENNESTVKIIINETQNQNLKLIDNEIKQEFDKINSYTNLEENQKSKCIKKDDIEYDSDLNQNIRNENNIIEINSNNEDKEEILNNLDNIDEKMPNNYPYNIKQNYESHSENIKNIEKNLEQVEKSNCQNVADLDNYEKSDSQNENEIDDNENEMDDNE